MELAGDHSSRLVRSSCSHIFYVFSSFPHKPLVHPSQLCSFLAFPNKPLAIDLKLDGYIDYVTPQIWLTFGNTPLNSCNFWPPIFVHLQINRWWNWTQLLRGFLGLINFCSLSAEPVVSWSLIGWIVFAHLQTNCWFDWDKIWWTNSPSLINFNRAPLFPSSDTPHPHPL